MGLRLLTLHHEGTCVRCSVAVPARSRAWWDRYSKSVVCVICEPVRRDDPLPPPPAIERSTAAAIAAADWPNGHASDNGHRRGAALVGRMMKLLADSPSSTPDPPGAEGERRLARLLDTELPDAVTLHDRTVPLTRGDLDHLVIASSGIWLVDAERRPGEVTCRTSGARESTRTRLFVNGRNQTRLVHALGWQVASVRAQLATIGFGDVPVHPVVCFTSSQWAHGASPFEVQGVLVTWPSALVQTIRIPGPFDCRLIEIVADHLGSALEGQGPSATSPSA
jgi:hypothetical protein